MVSADYKIQKNKINYSNDIETKWGNQKYSHRVSELQMKRFSFIVGNILVKIAMCKNAKYI